jgi:membrane protein DedA with SNARE-associated domain
VLQSVDVAALLVQLLLLVGVPVLLALFYAEGLVVGKVLPRSAVFVAYVAVIRPSERTLVLVVALCAVATTLGQWTLYRSFDPEQESRLGLARRLPYLDSIPPLIQRKVGEKRMRVVSRAFERFGGAAVCVTNVVPGTRCLMTIPAGMSRYPIERFLGYSLLGNALYMVLLVALTQGLLGALRFLPWP